MEISFTALNKLNDVKKKIKFNKNNPIDQVINILEDENVIKHLIFSLILSEKFNNNNKLKPQIKGNNKKSPDEQKLRKRSSKAKICERIISTK